MSRRTYGSPRRLGMESLESRQLMTVAVNVTVDGDLQVSGNGQNDQIRIVQSVTQGTAVPGKYSIAGLNGTVVTGTDSNGYVYNVSRDMTINLGGGNDKLYMGDGVSLNHFIAPRDLTISTANGDDSVQLNRITVRDGVIINTGAGRDKVGILASVGYGEVDDVGTNGLPINTRDLQINTGADADNVTVLGAYVRDTLSINTGASNHADIVTLNNTGANRVEVFTGAGGDTVSIDNMAVDVLFADLGSGNDTLKLKNATGNLLDVDGQDGTADVFRSLGNNNFEEFDIDNFEPTT